jgi:hypothetical protein
MAEETIPSAADPLRSREPSTRLPSLAQLYAAQQLGQSLQANSYTLPELYALEQTGAPLDLTPSPDTNPPQQSQSPAPQEQSLPILVDQSGAPLQPEPLTPGERLSGTARAAAQGLTGGLSILEKPGRGHFSAGNHSPSKRGAPPTQHSARGRQVRFKAKEVRPSTIISPTLEPRRSASPMCIPQRKPRPGGLAL